MWTCGLSFLEGFASGCEEVEVGGVGGVLRVVVAEERLGVAHERHIRRIPPPRQQVVEQHRQVRERDTDKHPRHHMVHEEEVVTQSHHERRVLGEDALDTLRALEHLHRVQRDPRRADAVDDVRGLETRIER